MIIDSFKNIIKFIKIFILNRIGFIIRKSLEYKKIGEYHKALRYLEILEKVVKIIGLHPNYNPPLLILKLELYFLIHDYEYIIKNIESQLESIDKHGLKSWTQADKNYLKLYLSMFVYFSYFFLKERDKADKLYIYMDKLDIGGVSDDVLFDKPPYRKQDLKKIFEEDSYYQENFSQNKLNYLLNKIAYFWGDDE